MGIYLLPILVGALISIGFCGLSKSRKRKPPFWVAICTACLVGAGAIFLAFGFSVFKWRFWTDNSLFDPAIAGVLFVFLPFALASLIPSLIVVAFYRVQMRRGSISGQV